MQKASMAKYVAFTSDNLGRLTEHLLFQYLIPWARVGKPRSDVLDEKLGDDLWNWLEEQTGRQASSST